MENASSPFLHLLGIAGILLIAPLSAASSSRIDSPDGRLQAVFTLTDGGEPRYSIQFNGQPALQESKLGLVRDDADFTKGLKLLEESPQQAIEDRYELLTAKRRNNLYRANRRIFRLGTANGGTMDVIFQVSNDGVAFRYHFPETSTETRTIQSDASTFHFLPETQAWLQPMQVAKSGWERTNPAYEEFYQKEIAVGTPSPMKEGWVFPALFRSGKTWLLVSESSLPRTYCASHLGHLSPDGEYTIAFPDARQTMNDQPVNPVSTLPWTTPWRFVAVGDLKTIVESTLGTDLADKPSQPVPADSIKPGKASWSWPLLGDNETKFDPQKRFIDYAADMGWAYCLIDADWDRKIGYEKMKELADHAKTKNVGILLWYNSAGNWNTVKYTPQNLMLTHESRVQEFERLKAMGVKGLKIDFFGGDGRPVIAYYHDILTDAAPYGFLINFHGATLPRGWQRTYPHLMTVEAIRGEEYITFEQKDADQQPTHSAMLPFTRNLFDPMDFTPVVLDTINKKIQRRTTSTFELALSVLFTSGIQHYAEIPEGLAKTSDYVRDFLKRVPSVWEDTKFIDGYPGKFVVLARKGDGRVYVAGINAEAAEKTFSLDLSQMPANGTLITDGDGGNLSFRREAVKLPANGKLDITLKPNGGFVLELK